MQFVVTVMVLALDFVVIVPALIAGLMMRRWADLGIAVVVASGIAMLVKYPAAYAMADRLAIPDPGLRLGAAIVVVVASAASGVFAAKVALRR